MIKRHILKIQGVKIEVLFDEDKPQLFTKFEPPPPWSKKVFNKVLDEYIKWRNDFVSEWSKRTGLKIMFVDSYSFVTVIDKGNVTREKLA
jgi:hypothetical protein